MEDRTVHVSLEDAETALRIARAVSQAGGPDGAQLEVAWLLGLFGASFAPADLGRVADALRLAGLACEPEIAAAPPDGRVTVVLFARRFADEPAPEPAPASTAPSAEEADQGVRRTAVLLAAAALPVLATVTLGSTVGVVFLVLAVVGIGAARLRPALLTRAGVVGGGPGAAARALVAVAAMTAVAALLGYPVQAGLDRRMAQERQEDVAAAAAAATVRERARVRAEQRRRDAEERLRRAREAAAELRAEALRRRRARAARDRRERRAAAAQRARERAAAEQAAAGQGTAAPTAPGTSEPAPDTAAPEAATPGAAAPQAATPGTATPQAAAPGAAPPDTAEPQALEGVPGLAPSPGWPFPPRRLG